MTPGGHIAIAARWLLVALALDLAVTRIALRLAIFVPKAPAAADVAGFLARLGAIVENVVPLVALVVLGLLLVEASGRGGSAWKAGLVLTAGVAVGGFLLRWAPPSPTATAALEGLTMGAVILVAVPAARAIGRDPYAGAVVALAAAASLHALARLTGAGVAAAGAPGVPELGLVLTALGGLAFVAGAVLASVVGLHAVARSGKPGISAVGHAWVVVGLMMGLLALVAAVAAPRTAGLLLIWGLGLPATFLAPLYGVGVAVAIVGLRGTRHSRPGLAAGVAAVALAGYGLASSGLVLAGLIGIALAAGALGDAAASPATDRRTAALPLHA